MLILLIFLQLLSFSEGNWGTCCGGASYAPYMNAMTPSGFPIYGMAPYASSSVATSGFPPVYSYGTGGSTYSIVGSGYSNPGAGYSTLGSGAGYSTLGSGAGIDFDSIPLGNVAPGSIVGQPVAIRYFNQPIPVDIDPAALRPLGPTTLMRIPIYGKIKTPVASSYRTESTPETYVSKYSKFNNIHSVDTDISRGYQPAYSNWNKQPIQAVFRQASSPSSSTFTHSETSAPISESSVSETSIVTSGNSYTPVAEVPAATYTKESVPASGYKIRATR